MILILQLHIMVYGVCFWGILVFDHLSDHVFDHLFDHTTHACMNRGQKQDPENQQYSHPSNTCEKLEGEEK